MKYKERTAYYNTYTKYYLYHRKIKPMVSSVHFQSSPSPLPSRIHISLSLLGVPCVCSKTYKLGYCLCPGRLLGPISSWTSSAMIPLTGLCLPGAREWYVCKKRTMQIKERMMHISLTYALEYMSAFIKLAFGTWGLPHLNSIM